MHLRPATVDDEEAIHRVHVRAIRELAGEHYRDAVIDAWTGGSEDDSNGTETAEDENADGKNGNGDGEGPAEDSRETDEDAQPENGKRFIAVVEPAGEGDDAATGPSGTIAGFGDVRFDPPEYLEEPADGGVRAVYVHPEFARQGVGSSLLERLEATARENGVGSLGLHASVNARPFYERHGYDVVTELTFEFGGEVEGPAVEMRKEL